jgi:hypothetical protein
MTSGRFTPAAATLMRISPSPGAGTGRCSATSMSGPPGALMPIAVIMVGMDIRTLGRPGNPALFRFSHPCAA